MFSFLSSKKSPVVKPAAGGDVCPVKPERPSADIWEKAPKGEERREDGCLGRADFSSGNNKDLYRK